MSYVTDLCAVFWSVVFAPWISTLLSKLKYNITSLESSDPSLVISFNKSVVQSQVIFDVMTVVVAPMLSVVVLDESCLR